MSGNLALVELVMKGTTITMLAKNKRKPVDMHLKDRLWGWTPLHYAAQEHTSRDLAWPRAISRGLAQSRVASRDLA